MIGCHRLPLLTLQLYDLAFGTAAIVVLDLAVWTIGAEVTAITVQPHPDAPAVLLDLLQCCCPLLLALHCWAQQVLHPRNAKVATLADLAGLLTLTLGPLGGPVCPSASAPLPLRLSVSLFATDTVHLSSVQVFYLGALAALLSSVIGNATGYGLLLAEFHRVTHNADRAIMAATWER